MKPGDFCISYGGSSHGPDRHNRYFGTVENIGPDYITVGLYDGSTILRTPEHVAVYLQLPANWNELHRRQAMYHQPIKKHPHA